MTKGQRPNINELTRWVRQEAKRAMEMAAEYERRNDILYVEYVSRGKALVDVLIRIEKGEEE